MDLTRIPTRITPEQLFARWRQARDPEALGELFDSAAPGLFRLALTLTPDAASAEDAVQETFLFAMEEADRHDPARPVVPWLTGILRLKVMEVRRRHARAPRPDRVEPPPLPDDPALEAMDAEEKERLRAAMQRLPEPYRGVALLRWRYGLEPAQIADVKGVAPGTVGSWLHRAVKRLKVEMGALPALMLAFRPARGLDAIRDALLRRAAATSLVSSAASTVFITGGVSMAAKFVVSGCVVVAAAALFVHGCGKESPPSTGTPAPAVTPATPLEAKSPPPASPTPAPGGNKSVPVAEAPPAPTSAPGSGGAYDPASATAVLRVRATVEGTVPAMRPIKVDADPKCAEMHTTTVYRQTIESVDGKLANVIAWVSKGAEGRTYATPSEPVVLDQKGCMYVPHVLTAQVNQAILIRNSDPTMHNVHAIPQRQGNEEFNRSQAIGAAEITEKFSKPEIAVKVKCDVHGWMEAYAGILEHPFHGVTDSTGTTEWKVPPGDYEISAWQESDKLAKPDPVKVTVGKGETKEIGFVFKVK